MPVKVGKMEIWGMKATVKNTANDARVRIYDDRAVNPGDNFGRILPDTFDGTTEIFDVKGLGNGNGNLEQSFSEPIKIRNGLSVSISDNIVAGSLAVFVR
jgi:hypothetical protein